MSKHLQGKIAVVAGASRGAGRGIAVALGEAGATVYVLGRTTRQSPKPADGAAGTIDDTADEVTRRGGRGIPIRTDCTKEAEVAAAFDRVRQEQGRLDVLANAVWGAADSVLTMEDALAAWSKPFWEQPTSQWRTMMTAGPYAYYLMSWHALQLMAKQGKGLIVGVTDGYFENATATAESPGGQLIWTLAHTCINQLHQGMSQEAKPHDIAVVTLMPGFMQTERVLMHVTTAEQKKMFRFDLSESPEYLGRAVAALAADAKVLAKTGKVHFVADLANEYGFTDIDGRQVPRFNPFER